MRNDPFFFIQSVGSSTVTIKSSDSSLSISAFRRSVMRCITGRIYPYGGSQEGFHLDFGHLGSGHL